MIWDQVILQSGFEYWLMQQLVNPDVEDIRLQVESLSNESDLLAAPLELLSLSDMVADPVMGLTSRYPEIHQESSEQALMTPATALLGLCTRHGINLRINHWLGCKNLVWQLLLLPKSTWDFHGISPKDISCDVIRELDDQGLLCESYHEHWHEELNAWCGISPLKDLPTDYVDSAEDYIQANLARFTSNSLLDIPHFELVQYVEAAELTQGEAVRKVFLLTAEHGILSSSLLSDLLNYQIDLSELPIPLPDDVHIEAFWLQSKNMAEGTQLTALACIAINAALVYLCQQQIPDLSLLKRISHPFSNLALIQLLGVRPDWLQYADYDQKSALIQDKMQLY